MRQWPAKGLHLNKQILASITSMQNCHESHHSKLMQRGSDHDEMIPKIELRKTGIHDLRKEGHYVDKIRKDKK